MKPAVEKARQFSAGITSHYNEALAECISSAVQDAVREIIVLMAEHRQAFRNSTCREVLVAALREKYGVKP